MYANEISKRIDAFEHLPYDCIFFDGPWGIGKSYAADNIEHKASTVRVSLTGLKNSEELYAEILDAFIGRNGFNNVIGKVVGTSTKFAKNLEETPLASGILSDVTGSFLSAKAALRIYFNRLKNMRTVILDDFERVWDGIDISEVFRVVEFLTGQERVRVVIIGDLTKLPENVSEKFNLYSERYIDRIFKISSISKDINWESLGIEPDFIKNFCQKHSILNLRSILKAQNLYQDLWYTLPASSSKFSLELSDVHVSNFWSAVRLACYAVVVEDIDQIYMPRIKKVHLLGREEDKLAELTCSELLRLENRAALYTQDSPLATKILAPVIDYYENDNLNIKTFVSVYNIAFQKEEPNYFFMSSEEIRKLLPDMKRKVNTCRALDQLVKSTEKYLICSELAGEDTAGLLSDFSNNLQRILDAAMRNSRISDFDPSHYQSLVHDRRLQEILSEVFLSSEKKYIHAQIDRLGQGCLSPDALEVSSQLLSDCHSDTYREILRSRIDDLMIADIYPIHAHDDNEYTASRNLLELLRETAPHKLAELWSSVQSEDMDAAARNRCEQIMQMAL
uniref:hypothetical protein n=1 Tax=Eubacterium cellulosolvens TaxID=29322 RepID=UPI00048000C9|nr:hypothetical protein [[Eubacterium] cellulosolvens]